MADVQHDAFAAIEVLDEVESTNRELMARACAGAPHGSALRARSQTAGRGRRSHGWTSPEGGLYLSVLIKPRVPDRVLPGIPVACGIGVVNALEALGCTDIRLKWPNDVICANGKLGGILVELGRQAGEALAVCGLGLNITAISMDWRDPNALPIAGLADCLPDDRVLPSLDELAEMVRASVLDAVELWSEGIEAAGPSAAPLTGIKAAYNELLAYRGERVHVSSPDGSVSENGVLTGVDVWGRALVELPNGDVKPYDSAQVSLRPVK